MMNNLRFIFVIICYNMLILDLRFFKVDIKKGDRDTIILISDKTKAKGTFQFLYVECS